MDFRSIDGTGNPCANPSANAAETAFIRTAPAHFADDELGLVDGPAPRLVSNLVVGEGDAGQENPQGLSGMMYAWGQFIDHDINRTADSGGPRIDITIPKGDPDFPDGALIPMTRAAVDAQGAPVNSVTGWLDASMIYGSTDAVAASLRGEDGRLRVSADDNLPLAHTNPGHEDSSSKGGRPGHLAGDVRADENPSLTALQTLFLREHNWQVERLRWQDPGLDGEALYQQARAIVAAEIGTVTYGEFLPHLLGSMAPATWEGHDPEVDPRIAVEFAGAAYRFGHSTVSPRTEKLDEFGEAAGESELRDAFFQSPERFAADGGADGMLRHLAGDLAQAMDARLVDDLRNFLVDPPVAIDLAAINIQRGRDLGLPHLNEMRQALGLEPYDDFGDVTSDAATAAALEAAYHSVDAVDLWTGGLAEQVMPGAFVGETFGTIIADQFTRLRDGDRLWWENQGFDAATAEAVRHTRLSDIILRNTDTQYIQEDVFVFHERRLKGAPAEHPGLPQLEITPPDAMLA